MVGTQSYQPVTPLSTPSSSGGFEEAARPWLFLPISPVSKLFPALFVPQSLDIGDQFALTPLLISTSQVALNATNMPVTSKFISSPPELCFYVPNHLLSLTVGAQSKPIIPLQS